MLVRFGHAELAENTTFLNYFKGLMVVPNADASIP